MSGVFLDHYVRVAVYELRCWLFLLSSLLLPVGQFRGEIVDGPDSNPQPSTLTLDNLGGY